VLPTGGDFKGEIGRGLTLAQVLKILEQTRVHFRIEEDKRIVIFP
jgi:transmembrane sensor